MKKFLSVLLTLALVANLTAIVFVNAVATESQQTKVFNFLDSYTAEELAELTADPDDYYVSVFVEFAYPGMDTDGLDELDRPSRNAAIRNYHMMQNLAIATQLGIPADAISSYAPYAELRYESIAAYEAAEDFVYSLGESDDVRDVEIAIDLRELHGVRQDSNLDVDSTVNFVNQYNFENAFTDIGIQDNDYMGQGINVGVMEVSLPSSTNGYDNYQVATGGYTYIGDDATHAAEVISCIGGDYGVAKESIVFIAAYGSIKTNIEWLLDRNVDIVNMSMGIESIVGYDNRCAYLDTIINMTGCMIVKSAGNTGDDLDDNDDENNISATYISSPGNIANGLTVGATNKYKRVAYFSSFYTPTSGVLKPDLVAPGEGLVFMSTLTINGGTSFAAPLVTGIAARLIGEFPILGSYPNLLKAVLLASCTPATDQTLQHDPYAGAGIVNYTNARQIMLDGNYGVIQKQSYMADNEYWGSFNIYASGYNCVDLHYAIQVPATSYPVVDLNSATFSFSKFDLSPVDTNDATKYQRNTTTTNTGAIEFPFNDGPDCSYLVEVYLNENCCPDKDEYIAYAYKTYFYLP